MNVCVGVFKCAAIGFGSMTLIGLQLTSVLYPQATVYRHSPTKPPASFDRTQAPHTEHSLGMETRARCRPPLVDSGVVVGWGVVKLVCGAFVVGVGCLSSFFLKEMKRYEIHVAPFEKTRWCRAASPLPFLWGCLPIVLFHSFML